MDGCSSAEQAFFQQIPFPIFYPLVFFLEKRVGLVETSGFLAFGEFVNLTGTPVVHGIQAAGQPVPVQGFDRIFFRQGIPGEVERQDFNSGLRIVAHVPAQVLQAVNPPPDALVDLHEPHRSVVVRYKKSDFLIFHDKMAKAAFLPSSGIHQVFEQVYVKS